MGHVRLLMPKVLGLATAGGTWLRQSTERLAYSDFVDSESVEAALAVASPTQRSKLLRWEYALLRAEALGRSRPSSLDLYWLRVDMSWAGSPVMAGIAVALQSLAVALITVVIVMLGRQVGLTLGWYVCVVLDVVMIAAVFRNAVKAFGRKARALRLVLESRDLDSAARRRLLDEALQLESSQA